MRWPSKGELFQVKNAIIQLSRIKRVFTRKGLKLTILNFTFTTNGSSWQLREGRQTRTLRRQYPTKYPGKHILQTRLCNSAVETIHFS